MSLLGHRSFALGLAAASLALVLGAGCDDDDSPSPADAGRGGAGGTTIPSGSGGAGGGSTGSGGKVDANADATGDADAVEVGGDGGIGPVAGEVDNHCGMTKQATHNIPEVCDYKSPADAAPPEEETPEFRYNTSADDDDCKYHFSYSVDKPAAENTDLYVTFTLTRKEDGQPATKADPEIILTLPNPANKDDIHVAPETNPVSTESTPGNYRVGPIRFDKAGRWEMRFHFYEECSDIPKDSPHGHVGFYYDVP